MSFNAVYKFVIRSKINHHVRDYRHFLYVKVNETRFSKTAKTFFYCFDRKKIFFVLAFSFKFNFPHR